MTEDSRAEKFLELFNKGKEFTEELLRENQRLRYRIASLETDQATASSDEVQRLRAEIQQLHSTLDFREVIQLVQEIVINLIGAESFAILLLDEKTNELKTIACEGEDVMPGIEGISARLGEGILGEVAKTGESYYINQDVEGTGKVTLEKPLAAVPLKIKEHVIG